MKDLLQHRIDSVLTDPQVLSAEGPYNEIMSRYDLLSRREHDAMQLAREVFIDALTRTPEFFSFSKQDVRIAAKIYGQVLDTLLIDVLITLINNGAMEEVRRTFLSSTDVSAEVYRHVVRDIIQQRIDELSVDALPITEPNPVVTELYESRNTTATSSELLTIAQTMDLLKVSRTTLHRLAVTGHLNPIKIGRSSRYEQSEIDKYLGRSVK